MANTAGILCLGQYQDPPGDSSSIRIVVQQWLQLILEGHASKPRSNHILTQLISTERRMRKDHERREICGKAHNTSVSGIMRSYRDTHRWQIVSRGLQMLSISICRQP